jgi:hypothetical protein
VSYYFDDPWYKDWIPWVLITIGAFTVVFIWLTYVDSVKFSRFVRDHHCKAIAQDPGYYTTIFITQSCGNGCTFLAPITMWEEGAKTWRCDDMADFKR